MLDEKRTLLDRLRAVIETGEGEIIADGQLLPERELMKTFGVGRRAVREALTVLVNEGMLFRRQGLGTFINVVEAKSTNIPSLTSRTSPQDIIEVRQEIEPVLARLAAVRATPMDIEQMKQFVHRAGQATTARQYERWDSAFHAKIAESVRNTLFWGVFDLVNSVRAEQRWINARDRSFSKNLAEILQSQHTKIVLAIEAREPETAESAMLDHLVTAGSRIARE
jgi:DNA-binding FadR family transcriptional regulator